MHQTLRNETREYVEMEAEAAATPAEKSAATPAALTIPRNTDSEPVADTTAMVQALAAADACAVTLRYLL